MTKLKSQCTPSFLGKLEKTAVRAAFAGAEVLMSYFGRRLQVQVKPDAGLVSQADLKSEKVIIQTLKKDFPGFGFLAEESSSNSDLESDLGSAIEGRWVIDPLDGTTNFIRRFPMFCISIAAEWQNKVRVGVILHPVLEELYVAVEGRGVRVNGKRCSVSRTKSLGDTLLTTGFTYRRSGLGTLKHEMSAFEALSKSARAVRRPGSAALDLAYTARGSFDGFWETGLSPWDVAAGSLMIVEAGGKISDFGGNPFKLSSPQILASNGYLHKELMNKVSESYQV